MPKTKDLSLEGKDFFEEKEIESKPIEKKIEPSPVINKTSNKQKQEFKFMFARKGNLYLEYNLNGILYGATIPFEEKYKNLKPGDKIIL
jgi:fructose-1,6-bisphosphatase